MTELLAKECKRSRQGSNEGGKGTIPKSLDGRREVPTMSQVLFPMQYIGCRKALGADIGAPNSFRAPSNLGTLLDVGLKDWQMR